MKHKLILVAVAAAMAGTPARSFRDVVIYDDYEVLQWMAMN